MNIFSIVEQYEKQFTLTPYHSPYHSFNTETANILTGIGIDEVIARYVNGNSAASRTYLGDALSSVIGLAKEDQSVSTQLGYSPYGETTQTGEANTNSNQYTARENDGSGLYYYRARYYDPVLKRFIAEDPIGLAGGINRWGYVGGGSGFVCGSRGAAVHVNDWADYGIVTPRIR